MIARIALAAALPVTVVLAGLPAVAQSVYGCTDLAGRHIMAAVEGADGVFYRINPDMFNFHPMAPESVAQMAALSQALASGGTTLIYVPVPTKSLAMPDQLPPLARDLGFDPDIAASVQDEAIRHLREAGVATVDLRQALRAGEGAPFFQADERMTPDGARRAAEAIAAALAQTAGFADLPKSRFETRQTGTSVLPSRMRSVLQRHCMIELPPVQTAIFATSRFESTTTTDNTIFGSGSGAGRIALLGTDYSGGPGANLAGFLAEATGLGVVEYAVEDGGAFAAMSSYLTSRDFSESRPAYLVWANPIFASLARTGDQPMRELIAAAGSSCRIALPLSAGFAPNAILADLSQLDPGQRHTLFVDADGAQATEARFDFAGASGLLRTRLILRHPAQVPTGRFYMPPEGLWPDGATTVQVTLDVAFGLAPRVTACVD